jgi:hypothetical protein
MLLNLGKGTQSFLRFCLQASVHKINSLLRIVIPRLIWVNFGHKLVGHYFVPYFFFRLSSIRSLGSHALVCYDPKGKIVSLKTMISIEHDFRCHVAWRPTCNVMITYALLPLEGNTKVCQL